MDDIYDVVVAGGGIIGASAGQHLAAAGYRTLLAERGDYGAATSSRTSRLQHCGLGYFSPASQSLGAFITNPKMAYDSMELARRAMRGRNEFVRSSPERVRKVEFFVPLFDEQSISKWKARLAFFLMESFDPGKLSLNFELLDAEAARRHPMLSHLGNSGKLRAAIRFDEYQFVWPERIVVDTIMKARDAGLEAFNHTAVAGLEKDGEGWAVTLAAPGGGTRRVRARAVVNCAGVWVDQVTRLIGPDAPVLNTGAKGTNIAVRLPEAFRGLGLETIMTDGEPYYIIPWGDLHYIGPKDKVNAGTPDGFRAGEDEIDSLIRETNTLFPSLKLTRADVLYSWAGARPRTAAAGKPLGSMLVQEHDLTDKGLRNVFVYTGGLLMTHRHAGRALTEAVRRRLAPSGAERKVDYGARVIASGETVSPASVAHAVANEQAATLADLLRGRFTHGWSEDLGIGAAAEAADLMARELAWDAERTAREIDDYRRLVVAEFRPRGVSF